MKFATYKCLSTILFILWCDCSSIDESFSTVEGVRESDEPLSFSFKKDSFDDFKCTLSDTVLTHAAMTKPPFYINKSIRNFINTLCLFFQYSEIIHNETFRNKIEVHFEYWSKVSCRVLNNNSDYVYDHESYKAHILNLESTIKGILKEQDPQKQIVSVKEENGRIFIKQNNSSNTRHLKIIPKEMDTFREDYKQNEVFVAYYNFYDEMYELFLQNLLGKTFSESSQNLFKAYGNLLAREAFKEWVASEDDRKFVQEPLNKLLRLLHKYIELVRSNHKSVPIDVILNPTEASLQASALIWNEINAIILKKLLTGDIPEYSYELYLKIFAKIIYEVREDSDDHDMLSGFAVEHRNALFTYKNMLKEAFQNNGKIKFDQKLSEESISLLVKNCLEMYF